MSSLLCTATGLAEEFTPRVAADDDVMTWFDPRELLAGLAAQQTPPEDEDHRR